ncbi:Hsp33 family molecular chaperone [Maricaulis sp. CAU 1757]
MSEVSETAEPSDPLGSRDDIVAGFQVEGRTVRGRITRLGSTLNKIIAPHDYPAPLARMVGEAAMIATLVGDALKFEGRLIVQANGNGPVRFVVAEYVAGGGVRAMASFDRDAVEGALAGAEDVAGHLGLLLGKGSFALTLDYGPDKDQYQGVVSLDAPSLAAAAETYFQQSEQTPTRLKLAVGEIWEGSEARTWRGGGALLQQVAGDQTRGASEEDWDHARALFETLGDEELLDPDLAAGSLLYRLFNEDGVRLQEPRPVPHRCTCERERLRAVIANFPPEDQAEMVADGRIVMTCQYCNRDWAFAPEEIGQAGQ